MGIAHRLATVRRRLVSLCIAGLCVTYTGIAQDATPVTPGSPGPTSIPKKPKDLLVLGARSNTLTGSDAQPWHLKATFTIFDENGNISDEGAFEEFWAGQHKRKTIFTSKSFAVTIYYTSDGMFRIGENKMTPGMFSMVEAEFTNPGMIGNGNLEHWVLGTEKQDVDGTQLTCAVVKGWSGPNGTVPMNGPTYCFEENRPILRSFYTPNHGSTIPNDGTIWRRDRILSFQGAYLAGDLEARRNGKPIVRAHLDAVESIKTVNEADFAPPPDAVAVPLRVNISGGVAQGLLLQKTTPVYPVYAKQQGITGTVILQAEIGKDGHIANLHVISGPPDLQQAALDAVETWVYRPYLLNGEAVSVMTTINVVFTLGR